METILTARAGERGGPAPYTAKKRARVERYGALRTTVAYQGGGTYQRTVQPIGGQWAPWPFNLLLSNPTTPGGLPPAGMR